MRKKKVTTAEYYSTQRKFQNALYFAKDLLRQFPVRGQGVHPLLDFVRLIGKGLQAQYLTNILYYVDWPDLPEAYFTELGWGMRFEEVYDCLKRVDSKPHRVCKDLLLPFPGSGQKLIRDMVHIGPGRKWGDWQQNMNHHIELWLPLGLGWVHSGEHSVTVALLQESSQVMAEDVFHMGPLLERFYCDGEFYRLQEDDSIAGPVHCLEMAVLFELGRLMLEQGLSFETFS